MLLYGENAKPYVAVLAGMHGEMGVPGKKGVSSCVAEPRAALGSVTWRCLSIWALNL